MIMNCALFFDITTILGVCIINHINLVKIFEVICEYILRHPISLNISYERGLGYLIFSLQALLIFDIWIIKKFLENQISEEVELACNFSIKAIPILTGILILGSIPRMGWLVPDQIGQ
ncbi:hypothetical protein FACS1894152_2210 [Bacilli bacterium]|nr:hypothetical protein FACS1894152_2210 [Bacilli bacterium]